MNRHKSNLSDKEKVVSRLCRDALFHAIRATNCINDQSQAYWEAFDTTDADYHLRLALEYLQHLRDKVDE